jgi:hypothetical protein
VAPIAEGVKREIVRYWRDGAAAGRQDRRVGTGCQSAANFGYCPLTITRPHPIFAPDWSTPHGVDRVKLRFCLRLRHPLRHLARADGGARLERRRPERIDSSARVRASPRAIPALARGAHPPATMRRQARGHARRFGYRVGAGMRSRPAAVCARKRPIRFPTPLSMAAATGWIATTERRRTRLPFRRASILEQWDIGHSGRYW